MPGIPRHGAEPRKECEIPHSWPSRANRFPKEFTEFAETRFAIRGLCRHYGQNEGGECLGSDVRMHSAYPVQGETPFFCIAEAGTTLFHITDGQRSGAKFETSVRHVRYTQEPVPVFVFF